MNSTVARSFPLIVNPLLDPCRRVDPRTLDFASRLSFPVAIVTSHFHSSFERPSGSLTMNSPGFDKLSPWAIFVVIVDVLNLSRSEINISEYCKYC